MIIDLDIAIRIWKFIPNIYSQDLQSFIYILLQADYFFISTKWKYKEKAEKLAMQPWNKARV